MEKPEVNDLVMGFLLSCMPIAKADENGPVVEGVVDAIRIILDKHMPEIRAAAKEYITTADLDALILSLLPVRNQIWYEAYAPYWLLHCLPVSDDPDYTYFNDLIVMYWHWKNQLWSKKGEACFTIMLPPTRGLIALAYQEERQSLKEYLEGKENNHKRTHQINGYSNHAADKHKQAANKKGAPNGQQG